MNSDLDDLYRDVVLDHSKHPRNFRRIENAPRMAEGHNPVCGDHIIVYLDSDGSTIRDVAFQGQACAICTASASMMTEAVKGETIDETIERFDRFHALLTDSNEPDLFDESLGKLVCFAGVRRFPIRVKCATLPWHTLKAAIDRTDAPVTTE